MSSWADFERLAPELAGSVRQLFDARRHKTLATLRAGGSPRLSGIETTIESGELCFGSMAASRKLADLLRDPRITLFSLSDDPTHGHEAEWDGDARISGVAVPVGAIEEGAEGHRFRCDIAEVVFTHLNESATLLAIESWTPERGYRLVERA